MKPSPSRSNNVAIVANGSIHNFADVAKNLHAFSYIIAADGGLNSCDNMGILPNIIIGDMDSISKELLAKYSQVEQKLYPTDKNKTDLELAVEEAISKKAEKVVIYGALEKRVDHSLYNLHLLTRYPGFLWIETEFETTFAIDRPTRVKCYPGQVISLLPLSDPAKEVSTTGLQWELTNAVINKNFMSISNISLNNFFDIDIAEGNLLCCLCKKTNEFI